MSVCKFGKALYAEASLVPIKRFKDSWRDVSFKFAGLLLRKRCGLVLVQTLKCSWVYSGEKRTRGQGWDDEDSVHGDFDMTAINQDSSSSYSYVAHLSAEWKDQGRNTLAFQGRIPEAKRRSPVLNVLVQEGVGISLACKNNLAGL